MDKLEELTRRRRQAHAELLALESKVYRAFLSLEEAAFSDGVLPKRAKELIAIGISVVINCESCMQWHIEQAAEFWCIKRGVLEHSRSASRWAADRPPRTPDSRWR